MYDLTRFPTIVVSGKPLTQVVDTTGAALGMAASGGMASIGRMMSAQVEISNHTLESLIQFLHMRASTTRNAYDRSKQWWGRWYNRMSGEHPVYVQLSGHHLVQTLTAVGQEAAVADIPQQAQCGIRIDIAEHYLADLKETYHAAK